MKTIINTVEAPSKTKTKKNKKYYQQGREPLKRENNKNYCKEYYKDCRDPLKKNEDYYNGSKLIIQS